MPTLEEYLAMMQPQAPSQKEKMMSMLGALGAGLLSAPNWQKGLAKGGLLAYQNNLGAQDRSSADKMAQLKMYQTAQQMADQDAQRDKQTRLGKAASDAFVPGMPGSPEMGPPTMQGEMQPAVDPKMPGYDMSKYLANVNAIDPQMAMEVHRGMQPKTPDSPFAKIDPSKFTPESLQKFIGSKSPADLRVIEQAKDQWEVIGRTPEGQMIQRNKATQQIQAVGSPGQRTTINMPAIESAEAKAKGTQNVTYYGELKAAADSARKENAVLQNLEKNPLQTGAGVPLTATAAAWASYAGIGGDKLKQYATDSQTFTRDTMDLVMTKQMAQKGPQTESDARRLEATVASAKNTNEANAAIIKFARAQNNRIVEQQRFYDQYWRQNKTYEGADAAWFGGKGGTSIWADIPNSAPAPRLTQQPGGRSASGIIGGGPAPAPGTVLRFDSNGNPI